MCSRGAERRLVTLTDVSVPDPSTVYDRVGGQAWFDALVERFYDRVETDPVLRPLYPADLGPGKRHLALFLGQYWGGPAAYNEERGQPQLRRRHLPFTIGRAERDAWVHHMVSAVEAVPLDAETQAELLTYLRDTATFLVNQDPLSLRPSR